MAKNPMEDTNPSLFASIKPQRDALPVKPKKMKEYRLVADRQYWYGNIIMKPRNGHMSVGVTQKNKVEKS